MREKGKVTKGRNETLFAGEWVYSGCERMAYKLDKQGTLIFNCKDDVSDEDKKDFSIEALVHMGTDRDKARGIVSLAKIM